MTLLERLLPEPGEVVTNRYELREEIGRGGFGVVFKARQMGLNEDVAIKILLPHVLENDAIAQRFEREVNVAKGLRHPNTIRILDYNRTAKGLPFYVMEFVSGHSLEDVLETELCLSPARTRNIVVQVLKALGEAHSIGVIHRDLKPANLILTEIYGEDDFVKVLDFGIAKALTNESGISQTTTGMVLGTPAYMSPEQALGRKTIDGRSDLYAMGLMIAECLMGRRVVEGETPYVVVAQHASLEPLAFPTVLLQSPLWPVIARSTAKTPHDRYPDATAMRKALEELGPLPTERRAELLAVARSNQPLPSVPGITPAVSGISSISSQRRVLGGNHNSQTMAADSAVMKLAGQRSSGALKAILLLIFIAAIVAGAVYAITRGGASTGDSSEGVAAADDDSTSTVGDDESSTGDDDGETTSDGQAGNSQVAGVSAEEIEQRAATMTAVAIATERIGSSMPAVRDVRFDGDDMTVALDDEVLGVTPFEAPLPRVDASLELDFTRDGYRSRSVDVSLLDEVVSVDLRRERQRTASRDDDRGDEPERDQPDDDEPERDQPDDERDEPDDDDSVSTSPFGQTPIHD